MEEARSRYRTGPFSWKAGLLFVLTSAGLVWYFEHEKERMQRKRVAEAVNGWARVFSGETGREYVAVGRVVRPEGWLDDVPVPELCEKARKQRPVRGWDRIREDRKGTLEQAGQGKAKGKA